MTSQCVRRADTPIETDMPMKREIITTAFVVALAALAPRVWADPPERAGRVSFLSGTASFRTAAAADWAPAVLNYPVTVGDHVWTDRNGRLELQLGATAIALDAYTAVSVLNLDHQIVQLRVMQGTVVARVRELAENESLEIDTPSGAITLLRPGVYRVDVPQAGDAATVTVRRGDAEVAAGPTAFPVHAGESAAVTGIDNPTHALRPAVALDEFEDWVSFREHRVEAGMSARYVPRAVVGYEDLDEFGSWSVVASYGPVWFPHVRAAWVPYRFGHWAWVEPWGWTWIDDAPWGFAPFHYGRWAYVNNGWAWLPGTIVARPVYAPALVAFIGGANWRVGIGIGQPLGWFPLGPREVYVPAYQVSPVYVQAINRPHVVSNTVTNITTNVTNVTYVNRNVAGAVTVVPRDAFVQGHAVAAAAVAVQPAAVQAATVVGHAAPMELRPSAVPRSAAPAAAPAPAVLARQVVVRTPPSAAAAPIVPVRAAAVPRQTVVAPAPAPTPGPGPVPAGAPAAAAPRAQVTDTRAAGPNRGAADVVSRHAQERVDIEARHAQERAELEARHRVEAERAANASSQAAVQAQHERERANLDARQKQEHSQMQQRQDVERQRRQRH
jgi:hypothetical protein